MRIVSLFSVYFQQVKMRNCIKLFNKHLYTIQLRIDLTIEDTVDREIYLYYKRLILLIV